MPATEPVTYADISARPTDTYTIITAMSPVTYAVIRDRRLHTFMTTAAMRPVTSAAQKELHSIPIQTDVTQAVIVAAP